VREINGNKIQILIFYCLNRLLIPDFTN